MPWSGAPGRIALVALLAAGGIVAAFGTLAPAPLAASLPASAAVEEALALSTLAAPAPGHYVREERFQRGETLPVFLARLGIGETQARLVSRMAAMRGLRPGTIVDAEVDAAGALARLRFLAERDRLVEIVADGEALRAREGAAALETQVTMRAGVIRSSLFAAADAAGIPDNVAIQLADVFAGDIDFYRDLRQGDRFAVVYESHWLAGRQVRAGRVVAAEFVNQGKRYRAVRYAGGYYAPDGGNLRKAFLRAPLEFSRISSGFGRRVHPMFKTWTAHDGIDYAAPAGTRVRAVGDGVVEFAGERGGYGKVVILRHRGAYSTVYAHLRGFAPNVRSGARLAQSDVVGFVGQTGWATGPHLHYEFRVAGVARNPRTLAMPAGAPVPPAELEAFRSQATPLLSRLQLISATPIA